MSAFALTVTYEDLGIGPAMDRLSDLGRDLTHEVLTPIKGALLTSTQLRITQTNVAPDGSPWAPSARVQASGGRTLFDTEALYRSISGYVEPNAVEIDAASPYAGAHQFGFSGPVNIPAHVRTITQAFGRALASAREVSVKAYSRQMDLPVRAFVGLSSDDVAAVVDIAEGALQRALEGQA